MESKQRFQYLHKGWRQAFSIMNSMPSEGQIDAWQAKYKATDEERAWMEELCEINQTMAAKRKRTRAEKKADQDGYVENARLAARRHVLMFHRKAVPA